MVIMITRARVSGCFHSTALAATIFVVSAVLGGAAVGVFIGGLGSLFGPFPRALLAGAAVLALVGSALRRPTPWQWNRETPLTWLTYQDWRTAAYNGVTLGAGLTTRIGFWLMYIVPIGVFAHAEPLIGAVVFGTYAAVRSVGGLVLAKISFHSQSAIEAVLHSYHPVRDAVDTLFFGAAGYIIVSFIP